MASIMSLTKNRVFENVMRYSREYLIGRERGFFGWRFLEGKVKVKGEGEQWNWRFKVRGFYRINGIYKIG
jgi:hypothetical protein